MTQVFLVDMVGNSSLRINALKRLFESSDVEKVIHDCRTDGDALYLLHNISLINVHDTSCFHKIITGSADKNLNDVLSRNGIPKNEARDKSDYKINHRFWATRPPTAQMISWASSDVDKLFRLADKQDSEAASRGSDSKAKALSEENATFASKMKLKTGLKCSIHIGRFIGPRGSKLRDIQNRTGTLIYNEHQPRGVVETWMIYYEEESDLARAMLFGLRY